VRVLSSSDSSDVSLDSDSAAANAEPNRPLPRADGVIDATVVAVEEDEAGDESDDEDDELDGVVASSGPKVVPLVVVGMGFERRSRTQDCGSCSGRSRCVRRCCCCSC